MSAAHAGPAARSYGFTFGAYNQAAPWTDVRTLSWDALVALLTSHETGTKEGTCIVPAIFSGSRRKKEFAVQIDVAILDSDAGFSLADISRAVQRCGWAAIISSTHSHLSTRTQCKRSHWEKFRIDAMDPATAAERFLLQEKGYLPRVAEGARVAAEEGELVYFHHAPCPKFRIAIPLLRPWRACDYPGQGTANAAWKERIAALADALGLAHDQACTDTSRVFYLPRCPQDGPSPETAVLDGSLCDLFSLPSAKTREHFQQRAKSNRSRAEKGARRRERLCYTDPDTGEVLDLADWARCLAGRFEVVDALRANRPDIFVGRVSDQTKHHIRCVNEAAHTQAGADTATFVVNASESTCQGFVYHCRHAHCDGGDRLGFLLQMLKEGWLLAKDLSDPRFLSQSEADLTVEGTAELTEHGVALAFTAKYSSSLRFCHTAGAWYVWIGSHWSKNETRLAFHWARQLTAELNRGTEFKTRAITGKAGFAAAVERFAGADETLAVTASAWNSDPWLLGTPGGVVDLRTGLLRPADRAEMITKTTAVTPAAVADCPRWLAFLNQATGGDDELANFLQRWFGYCLTGVTREHALVFLYGPGGNGKGVLLVTIAGILGDYAVVAAMDTFTTSQTDRHPTDLAMLHGARLVLSTETEEGRAWAEARIKALTGGDPITARFMRRDFFTFTPAFKLAISGNHKPALRNVDDAARRRFHMVPFLHKPESPDRNLPEKLREEWPGILRWMIEGCLAWQRDGLAPPKTVIDATAEYFAEQDVVAQWLEECCEVHPTYGEPVRVLYASWLRFATGRGEEAHNVNWFSTVLDRQGFRRAKDCKQFRGRGFLGLRLLPPAAAPHWQDRD